MAYRLLAAFVVAALLAGCGQEVPPVTVATPAELHAHDAEFREEVIEVADGIHVAVGFGIANSIMIEGDDGLIIVDTMESLEAAERINRRFRAISGKPVAAFIYTHSHPDHIHGAAAFLLPEQDAAAVAVYAHHSLEAAADEIIGVLQPIITQRAMHMYGSLLPPEQRSNIGIGPFLAVGADSHVHFLRPTHTFDDRLEVTVAGVRLQLEHVGGETDDQILVWLPERRVLLPGDNFYKAFPNLYTIRGTRYREPRHWAAAIDRMRALAPDYLIPSHGRPLAGAEQIQRHLTDYRDGIRYVFEQTVRLMNAGLTPDEIDSQLQLPPHLAQSPYLQQFYGKPGWSARAIFQGLLGWYDGNPSQLQPLSAPERARRLARLAGGEDALAQQVQDAAAAEDYQWVLELSDAVLQLDPDHGDVREARIAALRALAGTESNPNARHYYLSSAAQLAGDYQVPSRIQQPRPDMLAALPLPVFFDSLAVALDGPRAWDVHTRTVFEFPDLGETHTLIVRRGVTEYRSGAVAEPDIHLRIDSQVFKEMLAGLRNPALAIARDTEYITGGRVAFVRFMRLFNPDID